MRHGGSSRKEPTLISTNRSAGRRALLAAVACLALSVAAGHAQTTQVIKIGFASPLTGAQAHYGKDNQNGAQMAVDELNARAVRIGGGAAKFELLVEDDQADPKVGTVVAQKLIDAGIKAMVGHFNSGVTIPASRLYAEAGIPQLSVSTNVIYTRQKFKTAFRMMADDDKQGAALGRYATQTLKLKRFAVIDDRTAYGQGLADAFTNTIRAAKAQVVKREFTNDKAVDFRNILTSIRKERPEAIFFGGYDSQAGPMARQMRELGLEIPLLGGETMNTAKFLQLAGAAAEGHIASTPGAALESRPGGRAFAQRYRERFKQEIGLYAPYFYDSVMVIAAAMERAGTTAPAKLLPVLRNIRHSGVTAEIAFDNSGDLQRGLLSVFKVQNGKWVLQ
ncbi:MAG: branched-chain amino acid ABC transporter substrate-binding protein [Betaproteobacteria bacterium]|nr:MAG: branched-chain amino acid ABC transporter substrate-binding protein [Betaproteobacteria bacterium]